MKKELTKQERYELAGKLFGILGADLDFDEEDAIIEAIAVVSPEYAEDMDAAENAAVEFFENATEADLAELDATMPPDPKDQEFLKDIAALHAGELSLDEMKKKWRGK